MAFSRWGCEGSAVYTFPASTGGYECCACPLSTLEDEDQVFPASFITSSAEAFLHHLDTHRAAGQCVPDSAYAAFREWLAWEGHHPTEVEA